MARRLTQSPRDQRRPTARVQRISPRLVGHAPRDPRPDRRARRRRGGHRGSCDHRVQPRLRVVARARRRHRGVRQGRVTRAEPRLPRPGQGRDPRPEGPADRSSRTASALVARRRQLGGDGDRGRLGPHPRPPLEPRAAASGARRRHGAGGGRHTCARVAAAGVCGPGRAGSSRSRARRGAGGPRGGRDSCRPGRTVARGPPRRAGDLGRPGADASRSGAPSRTTICGRTTC